jgi:hypothetical protein
MVIEPEPEKPDEVRKLNLLANATTSFRNSNLGQRLLPASLLNFLAGLLAGAGINLLTGLETGPSRVPDRAIVIDSIAWIGAAVFAASAARFSEIAEQRAGLEMGQNFPAELNRQIRCDAAAKVSLQFWLFILLALAFVALAAARTP